LCDIARSRMDFRFWRKSGPDTDLHSCIYRWKVFCSAIKLFPGRSVTACDGGENVTKQLRRPRLAA
jgi:hypothetical protein